MDEEDFEDVTSTYNDFTTTSDATVVINGTTTTYVEVAISHALVLYLLPVIIFVGTLGNVLSIVVLFYSRMHSTSVYFYLIILAFADTAVLYVSGFKTWIKEMTNFELMHVSEPMCQLTNFLLLVSFHMAAWLLVLITLDRFIAVWFPLRATTLCTLFRSVMAATILFGVVLLYNLPVFWITELGPRRKCMQKTHPLALLLTYNTLKLMTYCVLPFFVILILNVMIIRRLRWTAPALHGRMTRGAASTASGAVTADGSSSYFGGSASNSATNHSIHNQTRVTYMLLTVSFAWLLLTGPFSFFSVVFMWAPPQNSHARAVYGLLRTIAFMLYYTNHSINFFLYCVTGNKFRHKLAELLFGCFKRRRFERGSAYSPSVKTVRSNFAMELELQERPTSIRRHYASIKNGDSITKSLM